MSLLELAGAALILLSVVALVLLAGVAARRFLPGLGPMAGSGGMRTLAVYGLDARHRAVILQCQGRHYLLVLSPNGACLVDRLGEDRA